MPIELRILRFRLDEVVESLRSLGPNIGLDIPDGEFISAITGSEEQDSNTTFAMSGSHENVTISNNKLAACLIHYCKIIDIPLPRAGTKEIYVSPKFVELRVGLHYPLKPLIAEDAVVLQT